MRRLLLTAAAGSLSLAACHTGPPLQPPPVIVSPPAWEFSGAARPGPMVGAQPVSGAPVQATDQFRQVVNQGDYQRLMGLDEAWLAALREARNAGKQNELAALGALVQENAALDRPQITPGEYRCRTIKMGGTRSLPLVVYGWFRCRVELTPGGDLTFTKLTGSQRPAGKFYPYRDTQLVFVGAVAWGDQETTAPAYGQIPERDQVGFLERIGPERWRLLLTWPKQESVLDIIELVPAR